MTLPLYKRLATEAPEAKKNLAQAAVGLTLAILAIPDASTAFDFAVAVDNMLTSLGIDGPGVDDTDRPDNYAASDTPLYLRLDESPVKKSVQRFMLALNLNALYIKDEALRNEYNDAMQTFWSALGIPTVEQLADNPEAYPKVALGALNEANEAAKRRNAELAELEAMFNLDLDGQAS